MRRPKQIHPGLLCTSTQESSTGNLSVNSSLQEERDPFQEINERQEGPLRTGTVVLRFAVPHKSPLR